MEIMQDKRLVVSDWHGFWDSWSVLVIIIQAAKILKNQHFL